MSHHQHRAEAPATVGCAVITVSDTRDESSDKSGALIKEKLTGAGHDIVHYVIVKDEPKQIKAEMAVLAEMRSCQAIILNGGTGIAARDTTYDTLTDMIEN